MSTAITSLTAADISEAPTLGPTLADVLALTPDMAVSSQARQNMTSAIRTLCRVLDREPRLVPIAAPVFRRLVADASPGAIKLSPSRWRNVKSDARRAIRLSGLGTTEYQASVPLTEAWERVAVRASNAAQRSALRRFGRFCSSCQLAPTEVTDGVVVRYAAFLDANQLSKAPARTVKDMIRAWNSFVATDPSGRFAALDSRSASRSYTPAWAAMPVGLAADAARFMAESLRPDPFHVDPFGTRAGLRPVRSSTAAQRDRMIRRLAAAEMHAGVPRDELNSLADLVHPDRLQRGLRFFLDRNGGKPGKQVFEMAHLARTIAKYWSRPPEDQLARISEWARNLDQRQDGMTERNRERLRQFGDRAVIHSFLMLPDRMIKVARRMPINSRSAKLVQTALAIALLTVAPLRIGNLRVLDQGRHFKRAFSLDDPTLQLVISRDEVKNAVDLRFPVPDRIREMLDLYMDLYQPLLTKGHPSTLLFPGRTGASLHETALRRCITVAIRDECGLHVHPHLFRHLGAFLFLQRNPGQYEPVRQLLGHKSIQTTITFYAGFLNDQAMELYSGVIDSFRREDDPAPTCNKTRRL